LVKYDGDITPPSPFTFCNATFTQKFCHGDTMSNISIWAGLFSLIGMLVSIFTHQTLGTSVVLGIFGGILLIVGIAGEKP